MLRRERAARTRRTGHTMASLLPANTATAWLVPNMAAHTRMCSTVFTTLLATMY